MELQIHANNALSLRAHLSCSLFLPDFVFAGTGTLISDSVPHFHLVEFCVNSFQKNLQMPFNSTMTPNFKFGMQDHLLQRCAWQVVLLQHQNALVNLSQPVPVPDLLSSESASEPPTLGIYQYHASVHDSQTRCRKNVSSIIFQCVYAHIVCIFLSTDENCMQFSDAAH